MRTLEDHEDVRKSGAILRVLSLKSGDFIRTPTQSTWVRDAPQEQCPTPKRTVRPALAAYTPHDGYARSVPGDRGHEMWAYAWPNAWPHASSRGIRAPRSRTTAPWAWI